MEHRILDVARSQNEKICKYLSVVVVFSFGGLLVWGPKTVIVWRFKTGENYAEIQPVVGCVDVLEISRTSVR